MATRVKVVAVLLAVLAVAACATRENYRNMLGGWIGKSETAVIDGWGVPDRHYETDGTKYMVYDRRSVQTMPGDPPRVFAHRHPGGGYTYTHIPGTPSTVWYSRCETTFVLVDGAVREARFDGDSCVL